MEQRQSAARMVRWRERERLRNRGYIRTQTSVSSFQDSILERSLPRRVAFHHVGLEYLADAALLVGRLTG